MENKEDTLRDIRKLSELGNLIGYISVNKNKPDTKHPSLSDYDREMICHALMSEICKICARIASGGEDE